MSDFLKNKRGSAALEFAICMPFMITLTIGAIEFGRALWCHHTLVEMTRDATRYLSRVPDPTNGTYQTAARNLALTGTFDGSGSPLIPPSFGTVTISFPAPTVVAPPAGGWSITQPATAESITTIASLDFTSSLIAWFGAATTIPIATAHSERLQTD